MYEDSSPSGAYVPEGALGVGHGWGDKARNLINYVSVLEGNKDMEKEYVGCSVVEEIAVSNMAVRVGIIEKVTL